MVESPWYRIPYKVRERLNALLLTADLLDMHARALESQALAYEGECIRRDVWRITETLCEKFDTVGHSD